MKRKQLLASGLFDNISVGFNWWDVVLKISVATVFTRCMKSLNLLNFPEAVFVHRAFDVSKCGVITGIHCNFVKQLCTPGVEKVTPDSDDVLAPPDWRWRSSSGSHWCPVVSFFWFHWVSAAGIAAIFFLRIIL